MRAIVPAMLATQRTLLASLLGATLALAACSKKKEAAPAETAAPTALTGAASAPTGVRTVAIQAGTEGYVPDTIPGAPGEKLVLVFTRTVEGDCLSELRTPEGQLVALPMNKPVEVAITVPATGSLTFTCGMKMFEGKIVAGG